MSSSNGDQQPPNEKWLIKCELTMTERQARLLLHAYSVGIEAVRSTESRDFHDSLAGLRDYSADEMTSVSLLLKNVLNMLVKREGRD